MNLVRHKEMQPMKNSATGTKFRNAPDPFRKVAGSTPSPRFDVTSTLHELLFHYGLNVERTGPWLFVTETGVWITAKVSPLDTASGATGVRLDVSFSSTRIGQKSLVETYTACAHDETTAIRQAFSLFIQGSLTTILATFIDHSIASDEVSWEIWKAKGRVWKACLGLLLVEELPEEMDSIGLIRRFRDVLLPTLSPGIHWLRIDFKMAKTIDSEALVAEILLDNDEWVEGKEILAKWEMPEGEYTWHQFLTLTES